MAPYTQTLVMTTLVVGVSITSVTSHWLIAWMGLEMSTLAIIPLMTQYHHPRAVEAATKYFLTQATAASTILFATTTNALLTGQWDIQLMTHPVPTTMVVLALCLKLGLAPFHIWLPEVLQGLDLNTGLILSTWQKVAPIILLVQIPAADPILLICLGATSTLVGGWGGLNQTQLRKILAYSSIAHLGWMLIIMQFVPAYTLLAFALYITMTTAMFLALKLYESTDINSLAMAWAKAPLLASILPLLMLALGGLPPSTGFLPKWLVLQELSKQELPLTATFAALTALLSLYFYLRLSYAIILTIAPNFITGLIPWRTSPPKVYFPLPTFLLATIMLLPMAPALLALVLI
nr:NADH dehydrogenase subunit 2 [Tridentiger trigonocephalus]